ncbi:GpE family phage tail protein [Loktanella sp. TSTF-M6]|uniref:GpE family phage tail protein n=1 Tax=Loktanella gaetbuli TaxID=2881335 RepID=A0ABS8BT09_9RHOB|nr:GpE family phage tail protein [Loktanella gaetbuli]MCB5198606.1 GpE family phage tail protein [Loktanella gaetbuli]
MADIAVVFGWGPDVTGPMTLDDLTYWWAKARDRAPRQEGDDD